MPATTLCIAASMTTTRTTENPMPPTTCLAIASTTTTPTKEHPMPATTTPAASITTTPTQENPMPATTCLAIASMTTATTTTKETPMPATTIPTAASITTPDKETPASPITVPPASGRRTRSFPKPDTDLYDAIERRAERELDWYFEKPADRSRRPEATACIEGWLAALPSFYRGAITLRYDTTRTWPARVATELRPYTAIAVRFYGANHPSIGPAGAVEQAVAKRIDEILEADDDRTCDVFDAFDRAHTFFGEAVVAFMKARGTGRCVAPWPRRPKPRVPPPPPPPPGPPMVKRIGRTGLIEVVPADPPAPAQPPPQS